MKTVIQNTFIISLTLCVLIIGPAFGQTGGPYDLSWSTIDGGGGRSSGGPYTLTSTIGQPDAAWSSGGDYELLGGFWTGGPLCFVDFESFARFAEQWRHTGAGADLDGSGVVDFADLGEFADLWLSCCPVGWPLK